MTRVIAIGGTTRPGSWTELALKTAANAARARGAEVEVFDGAVLVSLPHYGTEAAFQSAEGARLVEAARAADGVIIASPGYHGSISGLVKNALDYLEGLSKDERVYLDGRTVGLITTAYGHQAATNTLIALRSIAHALRGWPTPMGAALKLAPDMFDADGNCVDEGARGQLELVGTQVVTPPRRAAGQD